MAVALTTPALWLLGALGFLVRGGILVLIVPVLVLPSPVALRLLVGENLTSTGFTPGFYAIVALAAAVLVAAVLIGLLAAAHAEVAAFARFTSDEPAGGRRPLATAVFIVQLVALCVLVAAALPLVSGAIDATHAELLRPSLGGGLYERVMAQLGAEIYLLLAVLVVVEAASAVATRRLLAGGFGRASAIGSPLSALLDGLGRPLLRPLTTIGTALTGWLVTIGLVLPALWAVGLAWQSTRGALLATPLSGGGEEVGALLAVLVLCAAWLAALALAGLAAAVRAALWTTEELR